MVSTAGSPPLAPIGPGTAHGSPGLPDDFGEIFASRWVDLDLDHVRLHAVVGGDGPPLLLLGGWPQTWYAWRLLMPALAREFTVIAADPRGAGLSDKPSGDYDLATLAADMVGLMEVLGHERFAMVGHDVGMWTGYAMAADHSDRIARIALIDALIPGLAPSPPLFASREAITRVWHFVFNRLDGLNEALVAGREDVFFRWLFDNKATQPLSETAITEYIEAITREPGALHACFAFYRALDDDIAQNAERAKTPLTMPILTIAGENSIGELVEKTLQPVATNLRSIVLPDCGHFPAEEAPQAVLTALAEFLAPYRSARLHAVNPS
jgi:pimeloyl-ACP methyl ester carboxylesterase